MQEMPDFETRASGDEFQKTITASDLTIRAVIVGSR